ncbi:unnamed protein product [Rotaria sp. Silwood2]|nr:unnamed protein product [Rotaria sp. Silwood2]CAF3979020.1 unnamed protein product [Rotaria sp. Silwood2]
MTESIGTGATELTLPPTTTVLTSTDLISNHLPDSSSYFLFTTTAMTDMTTTIETITTTPTSTSSIITRIATVVSTSRSSGTHSTSTQLATTTSCYLDILPGYIVCLN